MVRTLIALAAASGAAAAAPTNVDTFRGETNVSQLLSLMFAGNTTAVGSNNAALQNGADGYLAGINGVSRVSDDFDQVWKDGTVNVAASALFFGDTLFDRNGLATPFGGQTHELTIDTVSGESATPGTVTFSSSGTSGSFGLVPGELFTWKATRGSVNANSDASVNTAMRSGTTDRMITFAIDLSVTTQMFDLSSFTRTNGAVDKESASVVDLTSLLGTKELDIDGNGLVYIHFFDTGNDGDFQDLVFISDGAQAVPLPTPAMLGAATLLGYAGARRRRG